MPFWRVTAVTGANSCSVEVAAEFGLPDDVDLYPKDPGEIRRAAISCPRPPLGIGG